MARIICPDPYYQGTLGSLTFRNGVATTNSPEAIAVARAAGYQVEEDQDAPTPPPGNASQEVWADWIIAHVPGIDQAMVREASRDDLRDLYASMHAQD